jgi:hypothetical protein
MTEGRNSPLSQIVESNNAESAQQLEFKTVLQQFQEVVQKLAVSVGKHSQELSDQIQVESSFGQTCKRPRIEPEQPGLEIVPFPTLNQKRTVQQEGNSLHQISHFAAPEAAPESWLTLANDPQAASFAHMVSIVHNVLQNQSRIMEDLLEIPELQHLQVFARIERARAPLERATTLLRMQSRAFALKNLLGQAPGAEQALALIHKTEALNAITGDNLTITDVAKLRNMVNTAIKLSSANRQQNAFRSTGAMNTHTSPMARMHSPQGPCFNCGQYGHLRAQCTHNYPAVPPFNTDTGLSRKSDYSMYFRKS